MKTIRNDIEELNKMIVKVTDCFYQQKLKEGYDKLEKLYPKLSAIINELGQLEIKDVVTVNINNISNDLRNSLQALEYKDYVLLSDILKYDLMSELSYISNHLDRVK